MDSLYNISLECAMIGLFRKLYIYIYVVLFSAVTPATEVRIAPPPDFRRRSHRVAPEIRLQKHYHPTTRFEKFKYVYLTKSLVRHATKQTINPGL